MRAESVSDRNWVWPSIFLTGGLAATALLIMPNYSGVLPALGLLPLWLMISGVIASTYAFACLVTAGVKSPIAHIAQTVMTDWRSLLMIAGGLTLAGLNMCAFMWTKPLLNYYVPFWADPHLAFLDRALFFGHDPWTLLGWLNSSGTAIFYHRAWFAMMIVTLLIVLCRPPTPEKSAIMLTYFLLWSVAGPLIHILLPAAGPVFYERLGYGDSFSAIKVPHEMSLMSDYLWHVYQTSQFGPSSGISAMPSLHIATTAWMILSIHVLARRWTWAIALPGLLIALLSISLGWHYAIDGLVGAAAAIVCFGTALAAYRRASTHRRTRSTIVATAMR